MKQTLVHTRLHMRMDTNNESKRALPEPWAI
jgi:hypothetical protein